MVCKVCWSLSYVVKFCVAAEHDRCGSMEYCEVNRAEYLVHLLRMNRLREFCGVHTVIIRIEQ